MENRERGRSKFIADSSVNKGPCFCKHIIEKVGSLSKLRIPPDFMKNHGSKLRRLAHVNLVGPCGKQKVSLHHEGDTYFHEEGWGKFRRSHSLGQLDFLIFNYDGRLTFNVTIFEGSSGMIRTYDVVGSSKRRMVCPQRHGEKKKVQGSTGIGSGVVKIEEED